MEMIHSRSYTYIIKNVYSNPADVFDTILQDERILERAYSVTDAYNDFINSAQQYGNSDEWLHALEQVPYAKDARYELKRKLFRAVANVNILEGIRFFTYHSLAVLHLANSSYGRKCKRSSLLSQEMKISI